MKKLKNGILNKISIIDILVILILIFVVASVIIKYNNVNKTNTTQDISSISFEYIVKFENVRPTSGEMLQVGDIVYDKVSGTEIGKISSITTTPATFQIETISGEIVNKDFESRADIYMIVETTGGIKNNEYMANNLIRILIGKSLEIKTKYVTITGVITNINKIEN